MPPYIFEIEMINHSRLCTKMMREYV